MRKYIFNGAVLSAALGIYTTIRETKEGVRDWKVLLLWISSAISLALAIGTVIEESRELDDGDA
ncbi:MAG TPA: hypothetical protein VGI08_12650 [Diaminobutyricibacter sp.]|jgi:hypothetical protein|uniref:hypothetical protein n=1 Tax=Leifsonia sp. McL0618 TaxID=3415677 RepID=UPI00338ACC80